MSRWQAVFKHGRALSTRSSNKRAEQDNSGSMGAVVGGVSAAALGYKLYSEKDKYLVQAKGAEVTQEKYLVQAKGAEVTYDQKSFDNRIRQYNTPDMVFNHFASLQMVDKTGIKTTMMSPLDFFGSITPDCSIHPGAGSGVYEEISDEKLITLRLDKSPVEGSILNEIGKNGLISYADYCFLLSLLSTPIRFVDTAFNLFDLTSDEKISAKEFAFVSTKMSHKLGGFGTYTDVDQSAILASNSGLLNYLFGKDRSKCISRDEFRMLHKNLLDEIIQLEFNEFDKDKTGSISEGDFCHFLLNRTRIPPSQKAKMLKRVDTIWPKKARGISFSSFKNFFLVLASGTELERGLFFLDVENIGVDLEEFRKVASWVSHNELSPHTAEVVFVLLDDAGEGRLHKESVGLVLFDWRKPRGYDTSSIHVQLGQLEI
eukprot:GFUD01049490.1.p1 GENE.GFUD01049490.1~~GFUD01049490.1.p1  ORF type:complete len:429 (+),score=99.60 GFUD01049490.1:85-1371(+)